MSEQGLNTSAFKLKGRLYTFTVMQVLSAEIETFKRQLQATIDKAPNLFNQLPVVLDCAGLADETFDLAALCQCLKAHQVLPVAVQGGSAWLNTLAQCEGLGILNGAATLDKPAPEVKQRDEASGFSQTKIQSNAVRSGQQIVAKQSDLTVIGPVSPGAEVLADGNIHIYGALRGRAIAGMSGEASARIFCQSLAAELIAIAGVYRLNESMETYAHPCQIYLKEDRIVIEPLGGLSAG